MAEPQILTYEQAAELGCAVTSWDKLGLDPSETFAVVTDVTDPVTTLIGYYATEALAVAAATANDTGAGRPHVVKRTTR